MAGVPGEIDEEASPPSHIPLLHFVVALVFLLVGVALGFLAVTDHSPPSRLGHVHALLAGWVCITIMGAMTQFVPVWSAEKLHSKALGRVQLAFVATGVAGMVAAASTGAIRWFFLPGTLAAVGFWIFSYNLLRTLPSVDPLKLDVTELHFLFAILYAVTATGAGVSLGLDLKYNFLASTSIQHGHLVSAHASLAVYGFIVTTVAGAIHQLSTMFTRTELTRLENRIQNVETALYPFAPAVTALGYLSGSQKAVTLGYIMLVIGLGCMAYLVARRLWTTHVDVVGHPLLVRYAVAIPFLAAWLGATSTNRSLFELSSTVFGNTGVSHLLFVGFLAFVVVGTLYHIVPFLIWIHRYSDLLGLGDVPLVDDLYSEKVERADLFITTAGTMTTATGLMFGNEPVLHVGIGALSGGYCLFVGNVVYTVQSHQPGGIIGVLTMNESAESVDM